jgi:rhodanese-related sulfurtransferase
MKNYLFSVLIIALTCTGSAQAAERPSNPKHQTSWDLYLNAAEAYEMKTKQGDKVFFVDVRDPIEIMFTGFTDVVDINIPFLMPNRSRWNDKKSVFLMEKNPDFEPAIAAALAARGLDKSTPIILMCRSGGTRGAPSTKALEGKGYKRVYVVVDGFEGASIKEGEKKNWRLVNGWKNSGLPWSYKLNKDKMYMPN